MNIIEQFINHPDMSLMEYELLVEQAGNPEAVKRLQEEALRIRRQYYGDKVYIRGLIEFTNYCKNNCYYCGIRRDNKSLQRYRLTKEQIMECCQNGYDLGFRTFVFQGGEDPWFTEDRMVSLVRSVHEAWPDCAITLSVGELPKETYRALKKAGADRYLLRHETADKSHYESLHPEGMSFSNRMQCLQNLRALGYQVGAGFMVGSPGQNKFHLAKELYFLSHFKPDMVGIGPFIPHHKTRYKEEPAGAVSMTLFLLSVIRILLPKVLLPATTALGTIDPYGREKGLLAGANVIMPNLSPEKYRKNYALYDNKICMGEEAAKCIRCLENRVASVGAQIVVDRGDVCK